MNLLDMWKQNALLSYSRRKR